MIVWTRLMLAITFGEAVDSLDAASGENSSRLEDQRRFFGIRSKHVRSNDRIFVLIGDDDYFDYVL